MRITPFLITVTAGLAALPAQAQDEAAEERATLLDRIVVTAGRAPAEVGTLAQSVIVIDREQIEAVRFGSTDPADIIARLVPGFAPSNQTLSGASETFRGRSVLIMVDGVPRNTPLRDNSRILSMIDLETVERIEVVNGASSLYGAGATGGTINFITKRGSSETPKVTLRTEASAYTKDIGASIAPSVSASVEGRLKNFDYFFSASGDMTRKTFDGRGNEMASDAMLGQGGGDRTKQGNLFAALGYEVDTRRFEMSFDWTYLEQKPKWFTTYATTPVSPDFNDPYVGDPLKEDSRYVTARFTESDFLLGALELKAYYNGIEKQAPFARLSSVNSIVYYSGDPTNPVTSQNQTVLRSDRIGVSATVNSSLDAIRDGLSLTWGLDYTYDHTTQEMVDGTTVIAPMTQHQIGAFAQAELPITERFRLQGGARFDQFFLKVDDFRRPAAIQFPGTLWPAVNVTGGSFTYNSPTFNGGGVFDLTRNLQAFGNFSQGYSLTDIGGFTRRAGVNSRAEICAAYGALAAAFGCSGTPTYAINYSDIAPEPQLVNTYEAGLRGDWGRVRATASAYISTSDNGVSYDVASNRVSQQKERIWGVEVSGAVDVTDRFTLGGLFSYQEGLYDANGDGTLSSNEHLPNNRIPNTIKANLYGEMRFAHDITTRAEVEFLSGRDKVPGERLDGATLLHLQLAKDFGNAGNLALAVRNVFDTYYVNPTASATRGGEVPGLGRTIALSYRVTF